MSYQIESLPVPTEGSECMYHLLHTEEDEESETIEESDLGTESPIWTDDTTLM